MYQIFLVFATILVKSSVFEDEFGEPLENDPIYAQRKKIQEDLKNFDPKNPHVIYRDLEKEKKEYGDTPEYKNREAFYNYHKDLEKLYNKSKFGNLWELSENQFNDFLLTYNWTFVAFHHNGSEISRKFYKQFIDFANKVTYQIYYFRSAIIFCDQEEKNFCKRQGVYNYPQQYLYYKNYSIPYTGEQNIYSLIIWLKKKINSTQYDEIVMKEDIYRLHKKDKFKQNILVLFGKDDSPNALEFYIAQKIYGNYIRFINIESKSLKKAIKLQNPQSKLLFLSGNLSLESQQKNITLDYISDFILQAYQNNLIHLNENNIQFIFDKNKFDNVFMLISQKNINDNYFKTFQNHQQGKQLQKTFFGYCIISNEYCQEIFNLYKDYDEGEFGNNTFILAFKYIPDQFTLKYISKEINSDLEIKDFINDYFFNKLQPIYKSEEIPKEQDEFFIKVVRKNFKELIFDPKRNRLLFAYSVQNDQILLDKFQGNFSVISQKIKKKHDIDIYWCDFDENDIDFLDFNNYPGILFFPQNSTDQYSLILDSMHSTELLKFPSKIIDRIGKILHPEESEKQNEENTKKEDL